MMWVELFQLIVKRKRSKTEEWKNIMRPKEK